MGDLEKRLSRLEAAQKQERAQLGTEALSRLSDEDLVAREDVQEDGS
jgi:hypothetical protein